MLVVVVTGWVRGWSKVCREGETQQSWYRVFVLLCTLYAVLASSHRQSLLVVVLSPLTSDIPLIIFNPLCMSLRSVRFMASKHNRLAIKLAVRKLVIASVCG